MNKSKRILIVEDDHDTRVTYRKTLEKEGFTVHSTTNGKNGIELLRNKSSSIKLILLDINMPIMDGNEFLRLKSLDTTIDKIPVVVISSQPDSLQHQVAEVIQKPPSLTDLIRIAKRFIF